MLNHAVEYYPRSYSLSIIVCQENVERKVDLAKRRHLPLRCLLRRFCVGALKMEVGLPSREFPKRPIAEEEQDLCGDCGTSVEKNVPWRAGAGGKIALMPFVETGDNGGSRDCHARPAQGPFQVFDRRKSFAPGAK